MQGDRDYSSCAVTVRPDGSLSCGGSATNQAGSFYFGNDDFTNIYNVQGNELIERVEWIVAIAGDFCETFRSSSNEELAGVALELRAYLPSMRTVAPACGFSRSR